MWYLPYILLRFVQLNTYNLVNFRRCGMPLGICFLADGSATWTKLLVYPKPTDFPSTTFTTINNWRRGNHGEVRQTQNPLRVIGRMCRQRKLCFPARAGRTIACLKTTIFSLAYTVCSVFSVARSIGWFRFVVFSVGAYSGLRFVTKSTYKAYLCSTVLAC